MLFSFGSTKDASEFITTKSKLARHVGIQPWPGALVAYMAMGDMSDSILKAPTRPKLDKVVTQSDGTTATITRKEENSEYKMEVDDYLVEMRTYSTKKEKWEEN